MTWAMQRQLFYVGVLLLFFLIFGFLITYSRFNQPPTCTDLKQNGSETGVDCGGSCQLACLAQVDPITILWSRAFKVIPGRYNAVAYLENRNKSEPGIDVGNSIPVYTTFEWAEAPVWTQVSEQKLDQLKIFISNINLEGQMSAPRLSATVKNSSLFAIPDVTVVAILYNDSGNAVSVSRTYLDKLNPEESAQINFTWPEPIQETVVAKEIIPMFDIFKAKLQ